MHGGRQGGGFGTALGSVQLTNVGTGSCVLSGLPGVVLASSNGVALSTSTVAPQSPRTNPLVVGPGGTGEFDFDWSNWCGPPPGPLDIEVTVAGANTARSGPFDGPPAYDYVPVCENSLQPSTLT